MSYLLLYHVYEARGSQLVFFKNNQNLLIVKVMLFDLNLIRKTIITKLY